MHSTAVATIVLLITTGSILAQNAPPAPAQQQPGAPGEPSTEGRSAVPRAPVGQRQPTMKDLPPDLAERQRTGEQPRDPVARDLDRQLRICRGC
jgi:hypothetical protein